MYILSQTFGCPEPAAINGRSSGAVLPYETLRCHILPFARCLLTPIACPSYGFDVRCHVPGCHVPIGNRRSYAALLEVISSQQGVKVSLATA